MDPTKTAAFEVGEGADACLLLHGFTGSPWEMRPLADALAARGLRVLVPLLPGHGHAPEDMEYADRHDWQAAAESAFASLANHRRVFVGGLSMGALLGLLLAAGHPDRVAALALLAPALRFRGPAMALLRLARGLPLLELARPWVTKASLDLEDETERAEAPVLEAFPSVRLHDVWALQDEARSALPRVVAPTLVAVAAKDHVVSADSGRELSLGLKNARPVRSIRVEAGWHQMIRDRGRGTVVAEVGDFFDRFS